MSFGHGESGSPEPARTPFAQSSEPRSSETDFDIFRSFHGPRLHGFALLVTLLDASLAERLAAAALQAIERRWTTLRHPERAAAWLRAHVVAGARRAAIRPSTRDGDWVEVAGLRIDAAVLEALAALSVLERASLIVHDIESLDQRDCATVVGRGPSAEARLAARARRRYLQYWIGMPTGNRPLTSPSGIAAQIVRVANGVTA